MTFGELLVIFSRKINLLLLFNGPEMLPLGSHKAKLFAETFSKDSILDGILAFSSRINMKMHNIRVTP